MTRGLLLVSTCILLENRQDIPRHPAEASSGFTERERRIFWQVENLWIVGLVSEFPYFRTKKTAECQPSPSYHCHHHSDYSRSPHSPLVIFGGVCIPKSNSQSGCGQPFLALVSIYSKVQIHQKPWISGSVNYTVLVS